MYVYTPVGYVPTYTMGVKSGALLRTSVSLSQKLRSNEVQALKASLQMLRLKSVAHEALLKRHQCWAQRLRFTLLQLVSFSQRLKPRKKHTARNQESESEHHPHKLANLKVHNQNPLAAAPGNFTLPPGMVDGHGHLSMDAMFAWEFGELPFPASKHNPCSEARRSHA